MTQVTEAFFREAVLRICSSLDINKSLERCLAYLQRFIPADSMHLSVYLPDVQMLQFIAAAGGSAEQNLNVISVPAIDWEAPENQRPGMEYVHIGNNPHDEPKILDTLHQLNVDTDFSIMIMRLSLDESYIGDVA
ncbi:MAG: sigma-54-dependent Fis family transcriptional regulator, partial [Desulfohalobiaceae bacterium]|nr:sigma-54-dependent Fis family transcriptional regulator [Desulfohalobiaceae bacterium]